MSDPRWGKLDNPEANAKREEDKLKTHRESWYDTSPATYANQQQEVLDKRSLIEQFAKMVEDFKLKGEELDQFAIDNDIPGICGYDGYQNWLDNDIIGDAIQWASSNHSC